MQNYGQGQRLNERQEKGNCFRIKFYILANFRIHLQEEQNRGKPNWEHLNDKLHVLITVEDTENRAAIKLQRAIDEVKKLLIPIVNHFVYSFQCVRFILFFRLKAKTSSKSAS